MTAAPCKLCGFISGHDADCAEYSRPATIRKQAERQRRKERGEVALSGWLSASDAFILKDMAKTAGVPQGEVVSQLIAYYRS